MLAMAIVLIALGGCTDKTAEQKYPKNTTASPLEQENVGEKIDEKMIAEDPLEKFRESFATKDFAVKHNQLPTFYFEKGQYVRFGDPKEKEGHKYYIFKDGKGFLIMPNEKSFQEYEITHNAVKTIANNKMTFIVDFLADTKNASWKNEGEYFVTTSPITVTEDLGGTSLIDAKIKINEKTGYLTDVFLKDAGSDWFTIGFELTEVPNIQSLKSFPRDYKKVEVE